MKNLKEPRIILRDYQKEAVDAAESYKGNPLVVAPTGSGKSMMIAELIRRACQRQETTLILSHVKEIIVQNEHTLKRFIGSAGCFQWGINCNALNQRDWFGEKVIAVFGTVQSVIATAKNAPCRIDNLVVDESHRLNDESSTSQYRKVIEILMPKKVYGFTATPYRQGIGHLTEGKIFDGTAYEITTQFLQDQKYLVKAKYFQRGRIDFRRIHIKNGEFDKKEIEAAFVKELKKSAKIILADTANYRHILVFCQSVKVARMMAEFLPDCLVVDAETKTGDRDEAVDKFRSGKVKYLCNVGVFTTGFDAPLTDCIVFQRATKSPVLYLQMLGRGLRVTDGKSHLTVFDYGQNVQRFGCENDIDFTSSMEGKTAKEVKRFKPCPKCGELIPLYVYFHAPPDGCGWRDAWNTWVCCGETYHRGVKACPKCGRTKTLLRRLPQMVLDTIKNAAASIWHWRH